MTATSERRLHLGLAIVVGICFLGVLLGTTSEVGYARDEGFYFFAARKYEAWFSLLASDRALALKRQQVDLAWTVNHEHPGLIKSLFALSHMKLQASAKWFAETGTSFRFPAMCFGAMAVSLTTLWAMRRVGLVAGLVAGLSLAFMPRVFFHAHLACFDVPITAMFVLTFFAFEKALSSEGPAWPLATGVLFGLALDTKHNAWFLPIAFLFHALLSLIAARLVRQRLWSATRRHVHALIAMALLGPAVLIVCWPWLWFDTLARFQAYASFHLNHDYYNMEFLGETYFQPPMPRLYAPLMSLATVPFITIALGCVGVAHWARAFVVDLREREHDALARHRTLLLWVIGVGVSYGPWLSTSTPIFGGTKHWMPAYPFMALLAGYGFQEAARALAAELRRIEKPRLATAIAPALAILVLASPVEQAVHAHPWGLSAYTPIVGGATGAATLGLNRGFWGYTTGSVTDVLNQAPKGALVYPHDTAASSWDMLHEDGRIRPDLRATWRVEDATMSLYHHEMHMQGEEYQAWVAMGTVSPVVVRGLDGVPVIWVYQRKQ
jgi:hypothetical protein